MAGKWEADAAHWSEWQQVKAQSISARIIDQVRAALFRGELKPGDLLGSETDLAQRFGTSRVPIRDAFKSLQAQGIINVKVGSSGGARIANGDPERFADALAIQLKLMAISIEELLEAQLVIEVMATELAVKRATSTDIEGLRRIVERLRALAAKHLTPSMARSFAELAMQFHVALIATARNRALSAQFKALRVILEPMYARRTSDLIAKRVISTDQKILDAIEARNAEQACSLVRRRLEIVRARQRVKAVKKARP